MPSTPKSSTAFAMSETRLHRRPTRSVRISIVISWAWSPTSLFSSATLSSTGRDGSVRARSSLILRSSTLVTENSSLPIRHASSAVARSFGASESRETRSAIREASPRICHLPFLIFPWSDTPVTACHRPDRRSSGRSSQTGWRCPAAWRQESCRQARWPGCRSRP